MGISGGVGGAKEANLCGSGSTILMTVGGEVVGEWMSSGDSRLLRAAWHAPEDSAGRVDPLISFDQSIVPGKI